VEWRDMPITPGDWRWAREGGESVARFGPAGVSLLALRCDMAGRRVVMDVAQAAAAPNASLTITTTSQSRTLPAYPRGGVVELTLNARDPLLDAMAFSRGRFMVNVAGSGALYVPSWPEVTRVIEDCRQG
jgi:hypothetical protein